MNSKKSNVPVPSLWSPLWLIATGNERAFRLFPLHGGGQIAGDPCLLTIPAAFDGPLSRDLDRWGEFTLHLPRSAPPSEGRLASSQRVRRGYFVLSPLLPLFPLALECLLRERVTCLDRLLFIAEVALVHVFDDGAGPMTLSDGRRIQKFLPLIPSGPSSSAPSEPK